MAKKRKANPKTTSSKKSKEESNTGKEEDSKIEEEEDKKFEEVSSSSSVTEKKEEISCSNTSSSSTSTSTTTNRKRKEEEISPSTTEFESITPELSPGVLNYIKSQNFTNPTPVQSSVIPLLLNYKDVCVEAVTGSGKTLAFLIPLIEILLRNDKLKKQEIGGIIISPTRELAKQIHSICCDLCKGVDLSQPLLLVGASRSVVDDIKEFDRLGSDILIATPGRLQDLLSRYDNFSVSTSLEVLILDEADVLLNMGFEQALNSILSKLPKQRRTGLFSATQTKGISNLVRAGLRNPVVVKVDISSGTQNKKTATPSSLTNYFISCPIYEKSSRLFHFMKEHSHEKLVVFFLTCADVEFYYKVFSNLLDQSETLEALHGKMNQKRREKTVEKLHASPNGVLFCTDVAARGIDIPDVHWVIQFDAPQNPDSYIHRVGRSARAGKTGNSLLMISEKEEAYIDFLKLKHVIISPLSPHLDLADEKTEEKCRKHFKAEEKVIMDGETEIRNILPGIREMELKDRDVLEKGTRAYIAHVRAYKEHHCSFIFRIKSLDLGLLAQTYCLLQLPKMQEMRKAFKKLNFYPAEVDIKAIPFLDKAREVARQNKYEKLSASGKLKEQKEEKKRIKELKKKKFEKLQESKGKKKKGRQQQIFEAWDDFAKEEKLYKKLKKKKISEEEYERLLRGDEVKGDTAKEGGDDDASVDSNSS